MPPTLCGGIFLLLSKAHFVLEDSTLKEKTEKWVFHLTCAMMLCLMAAMASTGDMKRNKYQVVSWGYVGLGLWTRGSRITKRPVALNLFPHERICNLKSPSQISISLNYKKKILTYWNDHLYMQYNYNLICFVDDIFELYYIE